MSKKILITGVASGFACLMPLTALAQAAAAAVAPASAASSPIIELTRVVITAQKRKEDIRDVPLSVSVLSGEQLQSQQINTIEDVTRNVPNISFSSQGGSGLGTVEIRGVSSLAGSATVALYLDDVSLTVPNTPYGGMAEPRFFDLQDAEVLRGPQGTLYGASSVGGTIKFISKQPDLKYFSGSTLETVSGTQHGGVNYEAQGVLNIPLIKNSVALRIGVEHGHESGYVNQVDQNTLKTIAKDINGDDYTVVKMALKADLGNGWSATPALFAQQYNMSDVDATYLQTQGGITLPRFETSKTVREPGHDRLVVPSFTLNGDTGFGTFTGVLAGYKRRFNRVEDGTSINDPSYAVLVPGQQGANLVAALNALSSAVEVQNLVDETSLEMRLASKDYDPKGSSPFTWIGGVYVQDQMTQAYDTEPVFGVDAAFANAGVNPGDPTQIEGGFPGDFPDDISFYAARHYHDQQASAFGELTYHLAPTLALTAGLREIYATEHFTREANYFYAGGPTTSDINGKWTATTPSFKLNWTLDPTLSVYGNVSKGVRLGGANRPIPDTPLVLSDIKLLGLSGGAPSTFNPDTVWSYEIGSKSDLLSHTMTMNVSAFYLNWKNIQQSILLPNAGYSFQTNAGDATSYGLEADIKARVTPSLTLNASLGLTHATFDADQPAFGSKNGVLNVRKGDSIEGVPKGSAALGFDYHWAVNDKVGAFVRGNGQWTGSSHGTLFRNTADYNRPSYFTADTSAGVNWDSWEFTAFIKNANNNHTVIQHPQIQDVNEAYYLRPRTIGVTGNYEF